MNHHLLVSNTDWFGIQEINPYEHTTDQPDAAATAAEHAAAVTEWRAAGFTIEQCESAPHAVDGVYTANQAFLLDNRAVMAQLPIGREDEVPWAHKLLESHTSDITDAPYLYSGQGDTLFVPGSNLHPPLLIVGYGHRTDPRMPAWLARHYDIEVVAVQAKTKRKFGRRVRNRITGLWDSYWYDIDIAVGIIDADTIAVCFDALTRTSRQRLQAACLKHRIDCIPVSVEESRDGFGCNLVSDGTTVMMSAGAPRLITALRERGKMVIAMTSVELRKGGGGYRCISLTLDNTRD